MSANPIVKTLNVLKDGLSGFLPGWEGASFYAFAFESAKETFHSSVIITVTDSGHTHDDP
jgi:hypothetical protein